VRNAELIFVMAILTVLLVIFVPMPPAVMDGFLVASLSISVMTLLMIAYIKDPLDFSIFPTMLLLSTALRLGLNIATTRLILTGAATEGTSAAGKVVEAFGLFVAGNEPLVGVVIFALITIVNFVVITKGGNRVSEVAARFTLDAMPGKQMAIDAELNSGAIDESEAKRRRQKVWSEATFYGSMDGSMKFVRGDAIAGILITFVNILGGLGMGVLKHGMTLSDAVSTFTILTVGDGLVSQVPALMVSVAAGLMVTRAVSSENLGRQFAGQMFAERRVIAVAAGFLSAIALVSMTQFSLLTVELMSASGILFAIYAWLGGKKRKIETKTVEAPKDEIKDLLKVEPMEIEVGVKLLRYVDPSLGGTLLDHVSLVRREMAERYGIVVPSIKIRDNMKLDSRTYVIKIRGVKAADGRLMPGYVMVMDGANDRWPTLEVTLANDPVTGRSGMWVPMGLAENISDPSASVRDCTSVIVDHLRHVVRSNASELLTRDEVKRILEAHGAQTSDIALLHKVLQGLLAEGVSIRDLSAIFDAMTEGGDSDAIIDRARRALARSICQSCVAPDGKLYAVLLEPEIEKVVRQSMGSGKTVQMNMEVFGHMTEAVMRELTHCPVPGYMPAVVTSPDIRRAVRGIVETINPSIPVLSLEELTRDLKVESIGVIRVQEAVAA
jgi:flagellar biosynthesis protein FlhA